MSVWVIRTSGSNSRIASTTAASASRPDVERIVAEVERTELGAERVAAFSASAWRTALTFSIVWPSCFHSSPDSPRSP